MGDCVFFGGMDSLQKNIPADSLLLVVVQFLTVGEIVAVVFLIHIFLGGAGGFATFCSPQRLMFWC